ncbi:glycerophosphodiester phosphodiesterase family protein [Mucilaginibacter aquaedulcis]|uniref:glycerophosphodiester phosphodiesterase family protein n=1 Tax=Mucilaginibacter aquaedulcis TaxID=1187081 RepID=UPI0025B4D566|nr:glycerophosphodiester phosphodiesterase family protein [Mucilaginibacter aquaedulcis]MDN3549540.1 glycerophosphodiester phosphodiesterase family protein [Mucilaginibacter aquaedulcis]
MKNLLKITTISLFSLYSLDSYGQVSKIISQLHDPNDKHVMVTAHRGDWRDAPENSLEAYKRAIELGVDVIEIDLNKTSDGVIVIMHDGTIDRTTNGKGKPSDYTLAEIKKFHLRNGLGRVTRHTIPTLEEVMTLAKGKVLVNLDKSYPYYIEAYEVLKKTGTLNQAIFKTEDTYQNVRAKYGKLLDSIVFMPVVNLDKPEARQIINEYQKQIKPVAFELNFQSDTSSILAKNDFINKNGSKIWINSLWASLNAGHEDDVAVDDGNTKDSWDWIINHGATMMQTDRIRELLAYLRKRSLHR